MISLTSQLLAAVKRLGYAVSIHHPRGGLSLSGAELPVPAGDYVELHAVKPGEPNEVHVSRVDDTGELAEYQAAAELARMAGIELDE